MKLPTLIKYLLLGISAGLIIIYCCLMMKTNNPDLSSGISLFFISVVYLVWEKRNCVSLNSDIISTCWGLLIMGLILHKALNLNLEQDDFFLRIYPLIGTFGITLIASGWRGLKQYGFAFLLFSFFAIPWELIYLVIDLSLLTAKFATFLLWILGFSVAREGLLISLPTGTIEVYYGCSGLRMILQLLGISLIFLVVMPSGIKEKILLPIMAIILGFVVNSIRVSFMAILVAMSRENAFYYWHIGQGSLIFSLVAVIILGLIFIQLNNFQLKLK